MKGGGDESVVASWILLVGYRNAHRIGAGAYHRCVRRRQVMADERSEPAKAGRPGLLPPMRIRLPKPLSAEEQEKLDRTRKESVEELKRKIEGG